MIVQRLGSGPAWALWFSLAASPVPAQFVSDSDFVSIDSVTYTAPLGSDQAFSLLVRLNTKTPAQVLTVPLSYAGHPNLTIDLSVTDAYGNKGVTQQTLGTNSLWWIRIADVDTVNKTILLAYAALGAPFPPSNGPLVRIHFKLLATPVADTVWVDSTFVPPGNYVAVTDPLGIEWTPQFTPGMIRLAFFGPWATGVTVGSPQDPLHLTHASPLVAWSYTNFLGSPQSSFEVECGTDEDWSVAEMWQPGVQAGAATSILYAGSPLADGQTYFGRIRVWDGTLWSYWTPTTFRMNTAPVTPVAVSPVGAELVFSLAPALTSTGAPDPEGDTVTYSFETYADSVLTVPLTSGSAANLPVWVTSPLPDNTRVWWRVRASDGYETTSFSSTQSFWVDGIPQSPGPVVLATPAHLSIVDESSVLLAWHKLIEYDPFDTLKYRLVVAHDFALTSTVYGEVLPDTARVLTGLLAADETYYWRVTCVDQRPGDSAHSIVRGFNTGSTGDVDGSGAINSADIIKLVNYVFRDGSPPSPLALGDVSGNCAVSATDIIYLVNFIFKAGLPPHVGCA